VSIDLARRRDELLALRERLLFATRARTHEQTQDDETGELPTFGDDELADRATETFDRELADSLGENAGEILREVDDALARIDAGTYGTCTACGKEIPEERLDAVPYASLCIEDKRRLEST
jgi:RNA polymerase-binding protein DksA